MPKKTSLFPSTTQVTPQSVQFDEKAKVDTNLRKAILDLNTKRMEKVRERRKIMEKDFKDGKEVWK
jgi:hypothetical protein